MPTEQPSKPLEQARAVITGVATGVATSVSSAWTAPSREITFYTDPINPNVAMAPRDRLQTALTACRPWGEFSSPHALRAPPASEIKVRVAANIETFFYNYLFVALSVLAITGIFRPFAALWLVAVGAAAWTLLVYRDDDILVREGWPVINRPIKLAFLGLLTILALTVGHVFGWIAVTAVFVSIFVFAHALFYELGTSDTV